jgi:hypothetical protein
MEGWIKLHRKIKDSKVFANPEIFKLWTLCLCKANHSHTWIHLDGVSDPIEVQPGQFITGRYSLHREFYQAESESNKSPLTVWRWLEKLSKWDNVNIKTNNKYTLVEIVNWELYQSSNGSEQKNEQQANSRQTTDEQQMNTEKNEENDNKEKKGNSSPPTFEEVKEYFLSKEYSIEQAEKFFNYYNEEMLDRGGRVWKDQNGKTVRSWKQKAIGTWMKDDNKKKKSETWDRDTNPLRYAN